MFKIDFIQTANNNKVRFTKSFEAKRQANKFIKVLLKAGKIEKRGFDYFTVSRNLELLINF